MVYTNIQRTEYMAYIVIYIQHTIAYAQVGNGLLLGEGRQFIFFS